LPHRLRVDCTELDAERLAEAGALIGADIEADDV
jgi:hypothetical protein